MAGKKKSAARSHHFALDVLERLGDKVLDHGLPFARSSVEWHPGWKVLH